MLLVYNFGPEVYLVSLQCDIPFAVLVHNLIVIYQEDQPKPQLLTHGQRSFIDN